MELKVGQVLNSKGRSVYGLLIGWRNRLIYEREYNWTHSAIITEVREDKILIHEALSRGFVAHWYDKIEVEKKIKQGFYAIGEIEVDLKDVKKYAERYMGRKYGYLDISHILLYWFFGREAKFLFTGSQYLICSEAIARILYDSSGKKINFEEEFNIPYDLIEPMHLWQSEKIEWLK